MDRRADAIVIGLGGMGASTAYQIAARGATVIGFDQFEPAHSRGSSHGASRIIRQAYYEHPGYVPLLMRAYDLWRKLEHDSGDDNLLQITGGIYFGTPNSATISGSLQSAVQYSLPYELLDAAEIHRRFPIFQVRADEVAVWEQNAGFVRPERAIQACLQQATQGGAELHFNEPVFGWEVTATGIVRVTTGKGVYESARLILTPGGWAPEMFSGLKIPLVVQRHVMAWFNPVGGIGPFMPDQFPIYLWENNLHSIFYGFPAIDGPTGGAKIAMHTGGDVCTPQSIDRTIRPWRRERAQRANVRAITCVERPSTQRIHVYVYDDSGSAFYCWAPSIAHTGCDCRRIFWTRFQVCSCDRRNSRRPHASRKNGAPDQLSLSRTFLMRLLRLSSF